MMYLAETNFKSFHDRISEVYAKQLQDISKNSDKNHASITVTFQVTEACNLCCTYCYQIQKSTHKMSFATAKSAVDYLFSDEFQKENPTIGIIIEFIGGEPFLEIDLISEISEYFVKQCLQKNHPWAKNYMFNITSNGLLYCDEKVQDYLQRWKYHTSLTITIDGCKELHDSCRVDACGNGSYDKAIAAVRHLKENYPFSLLSKLTLAPQNIDYIVPAIQNFIAEGYDYIMMNCVFEAVWNQADASRYYQQLKKVADYILETDWMYNTQNSISVFKMDSYCPTPLSDDRNSCGGNGQMLAIDWRGDFYPCIRYMKSALGNAVRPYIIGSCSTGIPKTADYIALTEMTRSSQSAQQCMSCEIGKGCGWCSAYNYQYFGAINKRCTSICDMHKAEALANVYFWNKFFVKYHYNQIFHNYCPEDWATAIIGEDEYNALSKLEYDAIHREDEFDEVIATNYSAFTDDDIQEWTCCD